MRMYSTSEIERSKIAPTSNGHTNCIYKLLQSLHIFTVHYCVLHLYVDTISLYTVRMFVESLHVLEQLLIVFKFVLFASNKHLNHHQSLCSACLMH